MQQTFVSNSLLASKTCIIFPKTRECLQCKEPEKTSNKFKKCGACKTVYYCGTNCQKLDWKRHKVFCKIGGEKSSSFDFMSCGGDTYGNVREGTIFYEGILEF